MVPSTLSLDILTEIIDVLAEQKLWKDIKKFSTLSSSCHQYCRNHLFANISVSGRKVQVNNGEDGTYMPSIERFITPINGHPDTAPYIRQLCLFSPQRDDQIGLILVLTKLVNLASLELDMLGGVFVLKDSPQIAHCIRHLPLINSITRGTPTHDL
ncbi:hypothetical protein BJ165DRAFT_1457882 [Panaeolus papilionaceus]|nr:hypothetical protein BJ165DRAFT_1457882 [Panaeolus papilionaceus]